MSIQSKLLKKLLGVFVFTCALSFAHAQGGPGGPGGDPGGDPVDTNVPIDGGITLLIAAGIGYAAKKRYDSRKKDKITGTYAEKQD